MLTNNPQQFIKQIELLEERKYKLKRAKVNFIVYWLKDRMEKK